MMFIIRTAGDTPSGDGFTVRLSRATPLAATPSAAVTGAAQGASHGASQGASTRDFFCGGDVDAARQQHPAVVPLHDGWYADDTGGGVAIWGQGRFWEIRDTPFTVRESSSDAPAQPTEKSEDGEIVNVRRAIFGV